MPSSSDLSQFKSPDGVRFESFDTCLAYDNLQKRLKFLELQWLGRPWAAVYTSIRKEQQRRGDKFAFASGEPWSVEKSLTSYIKHEPAAIEALKVRLEAVPGREDYNMAFSQLDSRLARIDAQGREFADSLLLDPQEAVVRLSCGAFSFR